jgi:hypothetical protein
VVEREVKQKEKTTREAPTRASSEQSEKEAEKLLKKKDNEKMDKIEGVTHNQWKRISKKF